MNRRQALELAWLGPVSAWALGPKDFWNKKPASEWTEDEVKKLLTKSPWTKETTMQMNLAGGGMREGGRGGVGRGGGGGRDDMGGMGGMDDGEGGRGAGGFGGGMGGRRGGGEGGPQVRMFVRWESAAPLQDARKRPRAPALADYYVLSVSGLPMRPPAAGTRQRAAKGEARANRAAMEARLKEAVRLQVKGRDPIAPVQVQRPNPQSPMMLLFFPRGPKPVQLSDKEIVFAVKMESFEAKVKFSLKDMVYRGELAL